MPKYIRNAGKQWTSQEERKLVQLAKENDTRQPARLTGERLTSEFGRQQYQDAILILVPADRQELTPAIM